MTDNIQEAVEDHKYSNEFSYQSFKELNSMFEEYPDLLSFEEAREILRVGKSLLYRLLRSGELKSIKFGRSYRIPKPLLVDYVIHRSIN